MVHFDCYWSVWALDQHVFNVSEPWGTSLRRIVQSIWHHISWNNRVCFVKTYLLQNTKKSWLFHLKMGCWVGRCFWVHFVILHFAVDLLSGFMIIDLLSRTFSDEVLHFYFVRFHVPFSCDRIYMWVDHEAWSLSWSSWCDNMHDLK